MSYNTKKDPCKAPACRIQSCLKDNNYQESACLEVLEQMRLCCLKYQGHKESLCCSGIRLDRSYLPENLEEKQSKNNNK